MLSLLKFKNIALIDEMALEFGKGVNFLTDKFLFYKRWRKIDWKAKNLERQFAPDAAFSNGKWTKPLPK